ncbi:MULTISPECIES: 2-keto-4-pentenoate hydratase [Prauserella salsuginis group]|uniref:2-oxo-3-hexenedioate decarboxylase n=2 Tax=Prauserella salsuginis group TaxID=2893672 RepID=A0A839XN26_9PSEU|nr:MULTISPECIES: fumarylacetoacetate hydrolase family protein [Prauserella salsuginis group]MBB3664660.1 2-oxo-3-hexenedioate decarboxylase [Prauserella sediminis]MCR3722127.1 2-oxo-3-hexenedioate decarboxylase [Prauserella flava]MCR3736124.1 2-oxo-3-hexenedioate decarboxylase [Prauserella salsuginis]
MTDDHRATGGGATLDQAEIDRLAAALDDAALNAAALSRQSALDGAPVADAYAVQRSVVRRRLDRGEQLTGLKMGLTSAAKMAQMGVDSPIWGRLTDTMAVGDGTLSLTGRIHPRIEPEVAFRIGRDAAPGDAFGDVVDAVAPALELIDSRYEGFRFTLPDVIADNTSAARYAIGPWQPVPAQLTDLAVTLDVDGTAVQTGSTAAILGDPRRAFDEAVRLADEDGLRLRAGWVLLAGAATAAEPVQAGTRVRATVDGLGAVSVEVRS